MKVLVTGAKGQLGSDVMAELTARGIAAVGTDVDDMDITDAGSVREVFLLERPDAVIHCAAWTAVDAAETEENRARVYAVNVTGTEHIAQCCREIGCKLMYISTDYVFDGCGDTPWQPDCTSFGPQNVYGRTKLAGERAVAAATDKFFIVRIAWVFGIHGNNFVKTMLRLGKTHPSLRVVSDQIGTPTYTPDLARLLADMIQTDKYGYYHATNEGGYIGWHEFAAEIFRQAGYTTEVCPVTTEEYGESKAKRPQNSRLSKDKLSENGFARLPTWQDALTRYLQAIGEYHAN